MLQHFLEMLEKNLKLFSAGGGGPQQRRPEWRCARGAG
jgi:hypothetical protein